MILLSRMKTPHFQHKDTSRDLDASGHPLSPRAVRFSAAFLAGDRLALTACELPVMETCCLVTGDARLKSPGCALL